MAEGLPEHSLAPAHCFAQLPAHVARVASGSQRLQPPGSRLHRSRGQQEGGRGSRLFASRCELPVVGSRSLPAQPQLRERDCGGKTTRAAVSGYGRSRQALHRRRRHLGLGQQRSRRGARRCDGVLRRCSHARNSGCRGPAAKAGAGSQDPGGERGRLNDAATGERTSPRWKPWPRWT